MKLQNERPETITRTTMIRTPQTKLIRLILRPDGTSKLYGLTNDPRELHSFYGDKNYTSVQSDVERRILVYRNQRRSASATRPSRFSVIA